MRLQHPGENGYDKISGRINGVPPQDCPGPFLESDRQGKPDVGCPFSVCQDTEDLELTNHIDGFEKLFVGIGNDLGVQQSTAVCVEPGPEFFSGQECNDRTHPPERFEVQDGMETGRSKDSEILSDRSEVVDHEQFVMVSDVIERVPRFSLAQQRHTASGRVFPQAPQQGDRHDSVPQATGTDDENPFIAFKPGEATLPLTNAEFRDENDEQEEDPKYRLVEEDQELAVHPIPAPDPATGAWR
jgi:hypothetical protein